MRIRGGHIFGAGRRKRDIAGWARGALALAMALLFATQGAIAHTQATDAEHGAAVVGVKCEKPGSPSNNGNTRAPTTHVGHNCDACIASIVSAAIETRFDFHVALSPARDVVPSYPRSAAARRTLWRAAHPARGPPTFS
jgi:hypothetical protein